MKKLLIFIVVAMLCLCSCTSEQKPEQVVIIGPNDDYEKAPDAYTAPIVTEPEPEYTPAPAPEVQDEMQPITDLSQYEFNGADGRVVSLASKSDFTHAIVFEWKGQKITVEAPKYTGLKIDEVHSYKANYRFNSAGYESINTSCGYFTIDRQGNVYNYKNYEKIPHDKNIYLKYYDTYDQYANRQVGDRVILEQVGQPGAYRQRLLSLENKPVSDYFDSISYFFEGLALISEDNKIGLIDQSGKVVLQPTIAYDHVEYPLPEPKQNKKMFLLGDMVNNAFMVSIGGELAVINIRREPLLDCSEFVSGLGDIDGYVLKDLNGDNIDELITKKALEVTVYGYGDNGFYKIGNHDFVTGTLRLLECENYPGIVVFTVEWGANRYRYFTVSDGVISIDYVFNYYYSLDVPQKYKYISDDKQLIAECEAAYNQNKDIVFLSIDN